MVFNRLIRWYLIKRYGEVQAFPPPVKPVKWIGRLRDDGEKGIVLAKIKPNWVDYYIVYQFKYWLYRLEQHYDRKSGFYKERNEKWALRDAIRRIEIEKALKDVGAD